MDFPNRHLRVTVPNKQMSEATNQKFSTDYAEHFWLEVLLGNNPSLIITIIVHEVFLNDSEYCLHFI